MTGIMRPTWLLTRSTYTGTVIMILIVLAAPVINDVIEPNEEDRGHFDHVIMRYMRERHIPGASIAVSLKGQFLVRKGYGKAGPYQMVSPWSLFRLGSVSKAITAMGVLRLYQDGYIKLDDEVFGVGGILKEYAPLSSGDSRLHDVTVENLLRHTGGWDHTLMGDPLMRRDLNTYFNQSGPLDQHSIITYMMSQTLHYDPGTRFSYSNFGYMVLGRVIERVTAMAYHTYIQNLLWGVGIYRMKLGNTSKAMADAFEVEYYSEYPGDRVQSIFPGEGLVSPPYGGFSMENMDATSGWVGSATEIVRLYEALNGTGDRGKRLLSADTFQLMIEEPQNVTGNSKRMWYGMGVVVQDKGRTFWHSGHLEGSTALVSRDDNGVTWAILTNYKVRHADLSDVMRYAIHRFHRDALTLNKTTGFTDPHQIASYVHSYSTDGNNIVKLLVPEYKMKDTINFLSPKGYRLTWIDATEYYGLVYFNTVWTKNDKTVWKAFINLSPSRYKRRFKAKVAQGYRLAFIETYIQRRRLRYAVVFIRDGWPPWVTYHGYTPQKHSEMFYHYLGQDYHLTVQSVTEYKGKVYVAAIYEKIYLGDIRVRMGLTSYDLSEELNKQMQNGRILSYIQAYERKGEVRFSAIWIPQTTFQWAVSDSMTKYTLLYKLQQYADISVPLACVTSYIHDDTLHFAALWL